jgi:hypothetical protein
MMAVESAGPRTALPAVSSEGAQLHMESTLSFMSAYRPLVMAPPTTVPSMGEFEGRLRSSEPARDASGFEDHAQSSGYVRTTLAGPIGEIPLGWKSSLGPQSVRSNAAMTIAREEPLEPPPELWSQERSCPGGIPVKSRGATFPALTI